jgi:hypothetical protein
MQHQVRFIPARTLRNACLTGLFLCLGQAHALDIYALSGSWSLDTTRSDTLAKAIQACLSGLDSVYQAKARERLLTTNAPMAKLSILPTESGRKVRIDSDRSDGPAVAVDGTLTATSNPARGEVFRRHVLLQPDALLEVYEAEDGRRSNAYRVSDDEKTLFVAVTVESGYLPRPLSYKLTYRLASRPQH